MDCRRSGILRGSDHLFAMLRRHSPALARCRAVDRPNTPGPCVSIEKPLEEFIVPAPTMMIFLSCVVILRQGIGSRSIAIFLERLPTRNSGGSLRSHVAFTGDQQTYRPHRRHRRFLPPFHLLRNRLIQLTPLPPLHFRGSARQGSDPGPLALPCPGVTGHVFAIALPR